MKILIESENIYYKKGLKSLILKSLPEQMSDSVLITNITPPHENNRINIIFRDAAISINIFIKKNHNSKTSTFEQKTTIHTPFICKNRSLTETTRIITKTIKIADMKIDEFINDDFYKISGLKKHEQLSLTETKIMLLIGKGNNINSISRQLHRSERTINVHFRNASRKMKLEKKVDFYNYAKFIVKCRKNERKTLCL